MEDLLELDTILGFALTPQLPPPAVSVAGAAAHGGPARAGHHPPLPALRGLADGAAPRCAELVDTAYRLALLLQLVLCILLPVVVVVVVVHYYYI